MSTLPEVLSPSDLPLAELCATRLDGETFGVDECFAPVDLPDSPRVRGLALARQFPPHWVFGRESAEWVLGARPAPPVRHRVYVDRERRARVGPRPRLVVTETRIPAEDLLDTGGATVTGVHRTLGDGARVRGRDATGSVALALLAALDRASAGHVDHVPGPPHARHPTGAPHRAVAAL